MPRWNWKHWQTAVVEKVTDADALTLASVLPGYCRSVHTRGFICYEMMYNGNAPLKDWQSARTLTASRVLEHAGFLSSCPGFGVLFAPEIPAKEEETHA